MDFFSQNVTFALLASKWLQIPPPSPLPLPPLLSKIWAEVSYKESLNLIPNPNPNPNLSPNPIGCLALILA